MPWFEQVFVAKIKVSQRWKYTLESGVKVRESKMVLCWQFSEKLRNYLEAKFRESKSTTVLYCLPIDNFDLTRKILEFLESKIFWNYNSLVSLTTMISRENYRYYLRSKFLKLQQFGIVVNFDFTRKLRILFESKIFGLPTLKNLKASKFLWNVDWT